MSIEHDLRSIPTPKTPKHEAFLKAALVSHVPAKRTRKLRLAPLFALAPAIALLLFVTVAVLQPAGKDGAGKPRTFGPLTAQQVFAEAEKNIQDGPLPAGKYYFTRVKFSTLLNHTATGCPTSEIIYDFYTNKQGIDVKQLSYTKDMKLYLVTTLSEDGTKPVAGYYYNASIEAETTSVLDCSVFRPETYSDVKPVGTNIENVPPEYKASTKLLSHVPSDQREGYAILKSIQGWTGSEIQTIQGFDSPVISLYTIDPWSGRYEYYYFDQFTKQFVGFENYYMRAIVLDRGIRELPKIPEADNNLTPSGL